MQNVLKFIGDYPLSLLLTVIIWVLCFINVPETPLENITLMDKWTHIAMYLVLGIVIFWESNRKRKRAMPPVQEMKKAKVVLWTFVLPTLMGGLIEILQANCTGGRRSGDWLDFAADSIGAALALAICMLPAKCRARGGKDS
ncbi:Predicted integral membrane protein [Segatella buccae]|uniref:Predicted integral membrane protein n=1 Tax=Segatella buccae TaxID=28126 RepID=A0AAQ1ZJ61_9BACT|nr:VanZ family protein [Segatella buccae]SUB80003.1 Predicted integral membrane protein [Segatella buccae]